MVKKLQVEFDDIAFLDFLVCCTWLLLTPDLISFMQCYLPLFNEIHLSILDNPLAAMVP